MKFLTGIALLGLTTPVAWGERIWASPYLQNVTRHSAELRWVCDSVQGLEVRVGRQLYRSEVAEAPELVYSKSEQAAIPQGPVVRYFHRVQVEGLVPGQAYDYEVGLESRFKARFRTLSVGRAPIRFIAYADSETEPESVGKPSPWPSLTEPKRLYPVDQDTGYRANLRAIQERQPQAVLIAGDLVESGGEQRDWDEFWKLNASLASQIQILPAIGNHESYGGPQDGKYSREAVQAARSKFYRYFSTGKDDSASERTPPYTAAGTTVIASVTISGSGQRIPDESENPVAYYSRQLGPVRLIFLDSCDGTPHQSESDSNYFMEPDPQTVADIAPGSRQYRWLEQQLSESQKRDAFTFVVFHHCPYSSGPHGVPAGQGPGRDTQSGQPLRQWTPLFLKYGVDVAITGHDEMWERSEVDGQETLPDGSTRPHCLQIYDVGIGGDGLRQAEVDNPLRKFLADTGCPEVWEGDQLVSGGRHYGHLEVNITPEGEHGWKATLDPVYLFPVQRSRDEGQGWRFERRLYPDTVILKSSQPRL